MPPRSPPDSTAQKDPTPVRREQQQARTHSAAAASGALSHPFLSAELPYKVSALTVPTISTNPVGRVALAHAHSHSHSLGLHAPSSSTGTSSSSNVTPSLTSVFPLRMLRTMLTHRLFFIPESSRGTRTSCPTTPHHVHAVSSPGE